MLKEAAVHTFSVCHTPGNGNILSKTLLLYVLFKMVSVTRMCVWYTHTRRRVFK